MNLTEIFPKAKQLSQEKDCKMFVIYDNKANTYSISNRSNPDGRRRVKFIIDGFAIEKVEEDSYRKKVKINL